MTASASPAPSPASVFAAFEHAVASYPDHPFLLIPAESCKAYAEGPLAYGYGEAMAEVQRLRRRYEGAGLAGRRVALMLENRPAFFFHWLALNAVGASIVPLNPDYRQAELSYLLRHSEAALAVVIDERVALLEQALADGPPVPVIGLGAFDEGIARVQAGGTPSPIGAATECALVYTSGTTGKPKGCLLSNDYFVLSGARYVGRRGHVELEAGRSRVLTPLPMFHMNALASSTMGVIMSGSCLIQLDRFHPRSFWAEVVATGATGMHCLGVMPAMLLSLPPCAEERAHRLRYATAANVEPQHHAAFEQRFGLPLVEGWSMTETGAGAAISADTEPRHIGTRCFGRVPDALELKLVGDAGQEVGADEAGEMLVRRRGAEPRRGFFSGYFKDEAATAAGWRDGWWHTGDVARRGADGSLHFVDRIKNIIRRSGENISALEVEQVLRRHPEIADVAVTSVNDAVRGEEVMACVVPAPSIAQDAQAAQRITAWALSQLAYYKAPGWVAFVAALPTTASQKLERGAIKQLAPTLLGAPGCFDLRALKRRDAALPQASQGG